MNLKLFLCSFKCLKTNYFAPRGSKKLCTCVLFFLCFCSDHHPSRADLSILVEHNNDPTGIRGKNNRFNILIVMLADQLFVFFPEDPKVGIKTIKQ